jgi:hypothetical protein
MRKLWLCAILCVFLLASCGSSPSMEATMTGAMPNMPMTTAHIHDSGDAIAHFAVTSSSKHLFPNQETIIRLLILDKWSKPIEKFELLHNKLVHLIIVSQDLSYFAHIHPIYIGAGLFEVTAKFPESGEYKLFADYMPAGMSEMIQTHRVHIEGVAPKSNALIPDKQLTRIASDKEVSLSFDHLMAGMDVSLTFEINAAGTHEPITNLQPYLGSIGHVVAIREDTKQFLHIHPLNNAESGPLAKFKINFPTSGIYKIWGQFQQNGEVFTIPFIIQVP